MGYPAAGCRHHVAAVEAALLFCCFNLCARWYSRKGARLGGTYQGSVQAVMCNLAALAHDCTGQNIAEAGDRDAAPKAVSTCLPSLDHQDYPSLQSFGPLKSFIPDMRTVGQEVADRRNWVEVKVGLAGDRHDILAAAMVCGQLN